MYFMLHPLPARFVYIVLMTASVKFGSIQIFTSWTGILRPTQHQIPPSPKFQLLTWETISATRYLSAASARKASSFPLMDKLTNGSTNQRVLRLPSQQAQMTLWPQLLEVASVVKVLNMLYLDSPASPCRWEKPSRECDWKNSPTRLGLPGLSGSLPCQHIQLKALLLSPIEGPRHTAAGGLVPGTYEPPYAQTCHIPAQVLSLPVRWRLYPKSQFVASGIGTPWLPPLSAAQLTMHPTSNFLFGSVGPTWTCWAHMDVVSCCYLG